MTSRLRLTLGLAVLAAGTRLVAALALGNRFYFIDEAIYVDAARHLLAGEGFGAHYANVPAQPVLLAALASPWSGSLVLLRCAHAIVVGAVGCVALLALGRRVWGPRAACVAGVVYAVDPLLVVAGALFYPDAVAAVVLTGMLLAACMAAREDRLAMSAVAGMLLGLAVQFRPVALVLLPVVALWVGTVVGARAARRALHALVVASACIVAVAPWALHNYDLHGQIVPLAMPGLQSAPVPAADMERHGLAASLLLAVWREPGKMARRVTHEFGYFWELYPTRLLSDDPGRLEDMHREDPRLPTEPNFSHTLRDVVSAASFGLELVLALIGLAVAWGRRRADSVLLVAVMLVYALGYAFFAAKLRYRIAVLPCLFLLAGVGTVTLERALGTRRDPGVRTTADVPDV